MTFKKLLCILGVILCVSVFTYIQCFANPLIGKWEVYSIKASDLITQVTLDRNKQAQPKEITFTDEEIILVNNAGHEHKATVEYKEIAKGVWSYSIDKGKKWNEIQIKDENTLIQKEKNHLDVEIEYVLHRKK